MCTRAELDIIMEEVIQQVSRLLGDKLNSVILFGSYARGDNTEDSDIDIMLILDCSKAQSLTYRRNISQIASRIGLSHDVVISILLRDKQDFNDKIHYMPFYRNIAQEGVRMYG
jgi:predicted nucleotidyltransferase